MCIEKYHIGKLWWKRHNSNKNPLIRTNENTLASAGFWLIRKGWKQLCSHPVWRSTLSPQMLPVFAGHSQDNKHGGQRKVCVNGGRSCGVRVRGTLTGPTAPIPLARFLIKVQVQSPWWYTPVREAGKTFTGWLSCQPAENSGKLVVFTKVCTFNGNTHDLNYF